MHGSNRGAAQVSVTWVIFLAVIALVAVLFAYISQDDRSKAEGSLDVARQAKEEAEQLAASADTDRRQASELLGFFDANDVSKQINADLAASAIADLSADFPDLPADATTFQDILPAIRAERRKLAERIDSLRSDVARLESELQTEKDARQTDLSTKDETIAELRGNLSDEQANAEERQTELEDRLATVEAQADELDQSKRELERELDDVVRAAGRSEEELVAALASARVQLAFTEGTRAEEADGTITSVSKELGLAWIDIGSLKRVVPGMSFTIRSAGANTADRRIKTEGVVLEVQSGLAKLQLGTLADPFDAVVRGDEVYNPLFDPTGERRAALAGRFAGNFDRDELSVVLAKMGVIVQERVDASTDMLILGGDIMVDEYGDPLEEPISPTELPIYGEAQARGVAVISFNTLRKYIQF